MAIAKSVKGRREPSLELEVVDTEGVTYRYRGIGTAPASATVHISDGVVGTHQDGTPMLAFKLERDAHGEPLLRQDGPGLLEKIAVHYQAKDNFLATDECELVS
jgi:hypothetical protein